MEPQQRHKGFVVGSTDSAHGTYWTVRVKDDTDPRNQKKFKVLSVDGNIKLIAGLNVTFLIGTFDGQQNSTVEKAFDVQIA